MEITRLEHTDIEGSGTLSSGTLRAGTSSKILEPPAAALAVSSSTAGTMRLALEGTGPSDYSRYYTNNRVRYPEHFVNIHTSTNPRQPGAPAQFNVDQRLGIPTTT